MASLKDGKTFILKNYTIRGRKYDITYYQLQHWRLEGQRASDNEWIVLDQHSNEPFDRLDVRTFDVSCEEELKAVKLTQTGNNTNGNYCLCINAFDIFGTLLEKE